MKSLIFAARIGLGCCLLFAFSLAAAQSQKEEKAKEAPATTAKRPVEPEAFEIVFADGGNLKMQLGDEKITLDTAYGKLHIAVTDIQKIDFATRVSEEDAQRISAAIADLGDSEFSKREAASAQLLKLREKAYPALLRAAEQEDQEVVRRAKELIQQITARVPADKLTVRPKDVVYTADSKITGRIEDVSLKARTSQFGAVQVKLADVRSLRSQAIQAQASSAMSGLDPMAQQRMQMEMMQRQAQQQQQMEMMRRRMQKKAQ